jgi:hypothetical protein
VVLCVVAVLLAVVLLAPITLSSQDLYAWASAPRGLGLPPPVWPLLVPVSLDVAAATCIAMTVVATWRRDRPGVFAALVWVFACASVYAQYTHGLAERAAGRAQDAWWAMPMFAALGPLLLEVTLHRLRRWARQDADELLLGAAGFGVRWLVAPWSTASAWAASRRWGIRSAPAALRWVADRTAVRALRGRPTEAVLYALGDPDVHGDLHTARVWLADRGVHVTHTALTEAASAGPTLTKASTTTNRVTGAGPVVDRRTESDSAPPRSDADGPTGQRGGRGRGRGQPARMVAENRPDVSDLMPVGRQLWARYAADGQALTRNTLMADLRAAGMTVSSERASALLARLRTEPGTADSAEGSA